MSEKIKVNWWCRLVGHKFISHHKEGRCKANAEIEEIKSKIREDYK